MKAVALIPARGGSKRLPRKNIMPFLGKPMISYTIEAAFNCECFEKVVVSTDDSEIAEISSKFGAEISWRGDDLSSDTAMVKEVALNFLQQELDWNHFYDLLSVLYSTAPLRTAVDIQQVVEMIDGNEVHHALAVKQYESPPHQALKVLSDGGRLSPMWPDIVAARADNLPELVVDNGSTYAVTTEKFLETPSFYAENMAGHLMPNWRSIDIDNHHDFELALHFAEQNDFRNQET